MSDRVWTVKSILIGGASHCCLCWFRLSSWICLKESFWGVINFRPTLDLFCCNIHVRIVLHCQKKKEKKNIKCTCVCCLCPGHKPDSEIIKYCVMFMSESIALCSSHIYRPLHSPPLHYNSLDPADLNNCLLYIPIFTRCVCVCVPVISHAVITALLAPNRSQECRAKLSLPT